MLIITRNVPSIVALAVLLQLCCPLHQAPVARALSSSQTHLIASDTNASSSSSPANELVIRRLADKQQRQAASNNDLHPSSPYHNQQQHHHHHTRHALNLSKLGVKLVGQPRLKPSISNFTLNNAHVLAASATEQQQKRLGLLDKICIGTSNRLSGQHNKSDHYQNLAERYRNCTYVIGNLEITWLDKSVEPDLSFLESIREISGYLLIAHVEVDKIRMPNLQIIRGRDLFRPSLQSDQKEEFALILIENELRTLELPNLREILAGNVGSYNNRNLCHFRTINWDEIINWPMYGSVFVYNGIEPECPDCDAACASGSCWGEGPELCQSKAPCSPACSPQNRCFGPSAAECCHSFCAGGCTGPKQTDCLACKNFYDDGECIQECPSMQRYNPSKFIWEPNPAGKYAFGGTCVKECPEQLFRDNGACVRTCPLNKRNVNGECVTCVEPCPKNCQNVDVVHSGNIDQLINCTVIEGSITIANISFTGAAYQIYSNNQSAAGAELHKYQPMHPSRLDVFRTLREITGYLNIQANHPDFKNLSCFRNLRSIGGRHQIDMVHALSISKTSLVSLNLRSLRKASGKIKIEDNKELCFADTIDWSQYNITKKEDIMTRGNADTLKCQQLGLQCHEQCAQDGCWGPGPDECLSCKNYKLDDYCVEDCSASSSSRDDGSPLSFDAGSNTCKRCHPECAGGCSGVEARHCWQCKSVKDGPYCVAECPSHKYNANGTCAECDKSCATGCSGPSNRLGDGGCNSCGKAIMTSAADLLFGGGAEAHCIGPEELCPEGYYQEYVGPHAEGALKSLAGKPVCRKCHHRCKSCTGMGSHVSVCDCAKYTAGEQCEDFCPRDYFADEASRQCIKCSPECNGCTGPTEADCISCRVYRIYYEAIVPQQMAALIDHQVAATPAAISTTRLTSVLAPSDNSAAAAAEPSLVTKQIRFNCTAQCPSDKPHRISESNMLDPYCSEDPSNDAESPRIVSLGSTWFLFTIIISAAIIICISIHRCQIEKDKTMELTKHLSGIIDGEPLKPSNMKPNLASLISIKETELRKGKKLGEGFGGSVYQGYWHPEDQKRKQKQPVAIKVLRDNGQSNVNKEFLNEAYIMASVDHPNLVRLLAVCMTPSHLMLVTQLMPLGCLLDYVKKCKNRCSSKQLLEWSKQIAKGMSYLEEHRLVHRDLALRNVLLQSKGHALISDFGLAKFLELDQCEYQSGGGKLPIKWLAPECIRERKFTHKSDVWAFGVTVWELLTFGQRPFEEYETKDVPMAIEKGARLHQPSYVSVEVYKLMYACWFYNPEDRPDFRTLTQNFVNFARDPERYLICGGAKGSSDTFRSFGGGGGGATVKGGGDKLDEADGTGGGGGCSQLELDDDVYNSADSLTYEEDDEEPPNTAMSTLPDLTPTTNNRLNEAFGFDMRHTAAAAAVRHRHHAMSESAEGGGVIGNHQLTPTLKNHISFFHNQQLVSDEQVFIDAPSSPATMSREHLAAAAAAQKAKNISINHLIATDANNNNFVQQHNNCWHTMSTNSLGQKSEQPTDMYDYLLPSPCTEEQSHYTYYTYPTYDNKSTPVTPSASCASTAVAMRNPPHSAGLSCVNNEEYFLTRVNYQSTNELLSAANGNSQQQQQQQLRNQSAKNDNQHRKLMSTSNGNIPHSLV